MALLHNFWKLKASSRSPFLYKGFFLPGGLMKYIFEKESSSSVVTRAPASGSVTGAVCHSITRHSFDSAFSTSFLSSRILSACHNSSTIFSIQVQALLSTESLACVFITSAFYCPLLQNFKFSCMKEARELGGSNLRMVLEAGLYLWTGRNFGGVLSQKERTIASNPSVDLRVSGLQHLWNAHALSDQYSQTDTVGVVDVRACEYRSYAFTSVYSSTFVIQRIDGFCDAIEDSEVQEVLVRGCIHAQDAIRKYRAFLMRAYFDVQRALILSVEYFLAEPLPSASGVHDSHWNFAGTGSSGFEFSGYHELSHSEDQSKNLDNEGVRFKNLRLVSGACCLPHPNKVKTGGEDAYFICSEEQVVGVADGVGGWADVGVDAGDYARELMLQSKIAVAQEPHGYIDPANIMVRAHARTKCRGSSTACILALSDYGLHAANLGDSGFMLMRNGRTVFKSPVQQHQFNIPFQLESGGSDPPCSAEVFSLQVAAGDVLVAGTDGLFDNLYDNEVIGIVIHSSRAGLDPQVTAQKIAALARERAEDCSRQTPFSTAAQEAGFRFYGGKLDDITVIVSYVTTSKPGISNSLPKL